MKVTQIPAWHLPTLRTSTTHLILLWFSRVTSASCSANLPLSASYFLFNSSNVIPSSPSSGRVGEGTEVTCGIEPVACGVAEVTVGDWETADSFGFWDGLLEQYWKTAIAIAINRAAMARPTFCLWRRSPTTSRNKATRSDAVCFSFGGSVGSYWISKKYFS